MDIVHTRLTEAEVRQVLERGNSDFSPSLSEDFLEAYAKKLSAYAEFLILRDAMAVCGCLAYYLNQEGAFAYVSHFWVSGKCQGQGYGRRLLHTLVSQVRDDYREIRLEVVKGTPATAFYAKMGFGVLEDRGEKNLLVLSL